MRLKCAQAQSRDTCKYTLDKRTADSYNLVEMVEDLRKSYTNFTPTLRECESVRADALSHRFSHEERKVVIDEKVDGPAVGRDARAEFRVRAGGERVRRDRTDHHYLVACA